jgi:hypothetical protein
MSNKPTPVVAAPVIAPAVVAQDKEDQALADKIAAYAITALVKNEALDNNISEEQASAYLMSNGINNISLNNYLATATTVTFKSDIASILPSHNITNAEFNSFIDNKLLNGLNNLRLAVSKAQASGITINDAIAKLTEKDLKSKDIAPDTVIDLVKKASPNDILELENLSYKQSNYERNPTLFTMPVNEVVTSIMVNNLSNVMQQLIVRKPNNFGVITALAILIEPNSSNNNFEFNSKTDELVDDYYTNELQDSTRPNIWDDVNSMSLTQKNLIITIPKYSLNSVGDPGVSYFIQLEQDCK